MKIPRQRPAARDARGRVLPGYLARCGPSSLRDLDARRRRPAIEGRRVERAARSVDVACPGASPTATGVGCDRGALARVRCDARGSLPPPPASWWERLGFWRGLTAAFAAVAVVSLGLVMRPAPQPVTEVKFVEVAPTAIASVRRPEERPPRRDRDADALGGRDAEGRRRRRDPERPRVATVGHGQWQGPRVGGPRARERADDAGRDARSRRRRCCRRRRHSVSRSSRPVVPRSRRRFSGSVRPSR